MPKDYAIQLNDNTDSGTIGDVKIDVLRDAQGKIVRGMVIGHTLFQNQALIMVSREGSNKEFPDLGVGFGDTLLGDDLLSYRHKIRQHMGKDGMSVARLDLYEGKPFRLEANYGNS